MILRGSRLACAFAMFALAVAGACSSFDEADTTPVPDDGATTEAGDASALDGAAQACDPEPVWAEPDGSAPLTAQCEPGLPSDLLRSKQHCGRCNHSCGDAGCAGGNCEVATLRTEPTNFLTADDDAIYYEQYYSHAVYRTTRTGMIQYIGSIAGGDDAGIQPLSGTTDGKTLWLLTTDTIYTAQLEAGLPVGINVLVSVPPDGEGHIVSIGSRLYITQSIGGKVLRVEKTGGNAMIVAASPSAGPGVRRGNDLVWLERQWIYVVGGASALRVANPQDNLFSLLEGAGNLGAVAADGDRAYVTRHAPTGAVLEANLADGGVTTLYEGPMNAAGGFGLSIVVDATHLYWFAPTDVPGVSDLYKRARCGGQSVRIARDLVYTSAIAITGDSLFIHSRDAIGLIAK